MPLSLADQQALDRWERLYLDPDWDSVRGYRENYAAESEGWDDDDQG